MDLPNFDQTNEGGELTDLQNEVKSDETLNNESGSYCGAISNNGVRCSLRT